jgi:myo-inositol-1(or 4)-monophosphatase
VSAAPGSGSSRGAPGSGSSKGAPESGSSRGEQAASEKSSSRAELLELAIEVARTAGALLLERFDGGRERALASKTSPTDLVSEADLVSERLIRERLAQARPADAFLGEEEGGQDGSPAAPAGRPGRGSGLTWIVDPLDGTVNFLFSIPQWSVSIAVADADGVLAGAIFDPCRDELFSATRDGPPTLNGAPIKASERADLASAMVATGFAYDAQVRAAQAAVFARLIPRVRDIRRFGSAALDLAWTAAGRYDAYFERSVKPWDVAAGTLICERAGLTVRDLAERERLPLGVLVAAPALAGELFELVA